MKFIPISIEKYIKKHMQNNPLEEEDVLRKNLLKALKDHGSDIKCSCGNDIWVIGSAFVGAKCFSCITGNGYPDKEYEIDSAISKSLPKEGLKNIDDMHESEINGFFDDDGFQINTDLIPKPSMCLICKNDNDLHQKMFCDMTRYDQIDELEFKCHMFNKIT